MGETPARINHTGGKVGKPKMSQEVFDEVCYRIEEGRSLRSICEDADMPHRRDVNKWINEVEGASDQYARACDERAEYLAELALIEASNESTDAGSVNRDRLKVDTIKWFASKLKPKKWGDRIQTEDVTEHPRTLVIVSPKHDGDKTP